MRLMILPFRAGMSVLLILENREAEQDDRQY
jgi:hypothetical protein